MIMVLLFVLGGVIGWVFHAVFRKCNSYRMLKRLDAYHKIEAHK